MAGLLDAKIIALPNVTKRKSRWGVSDAYYVGDREVGHYHTPHEIDIRVTKGHTKRFRSDLRAKLRKHSSDWVALRFNSEADFELILEAMELAVSSNQPETAEVQ